MCPRPLALLPCSRQPQGHCPVSKKKFLSTHHPKSPRCSLRPPPPAPLGFPAAANDMPTEAPGLRPCESCQQGRPAHRLTFPWEAVGSCLSDAPQQPWGRIMPPRTPGQFLECLHHRPTPGDWQICLLLKYPKLCDHHCLCVILCWHLPICFWSPFKRQYSPPAASQGHEARRGQVAGEDSGAGAGAVRP